MKDFSINPNDFNNQNNPPSGNGNNNNGNNNPNNNGLSKIANMLNAQIGPVPSGNDPTDMLINYNDKFQQAGYCLFRDAVIQQTISCLISKNKPNALLIGPAGVGKTKIVEDLAYRLATNDVLIPAQLQGYTIFELPLANIVSGSSLVGQLEEKLMSVIDYCEDPKHKVILFIDEIHQVVNGNSVYEKIAQILKPSLARGDMKVIGATTNQEANSMMDDPAFNRRFSRVIIDELTREQTFAILQNALQSLLLHYKNISVTDEVLHACTVIADDYRPSGNHRPDTALTLLDRSMADAIITRQVQTAEAKASNNTILLQALTSVPIIPVTEKQIMRTAKKMATGNSQKDTLNTDDLQNDLSVIKGQSDIVESLIDILKRFDLNLFPRQKPKTLMFIGPSGVGKTEVTKIISKHITSQPPIILNMTEFSDPSTINRLIGSPPGYVGSDSNAELPFDPLDSNPYQIILLDEFEKAHPSVQRLFMSVLDEGYLTTNKGKRYDFSKSIVIATTNAAYQVIKNSIGFGNIEGVNTCQTSVKDLSDFFDPALLNRFEHRIVFHEITKNVYRDILTDIYAREIERIRSEHSNIVLPDTIPADDMEALIEETYEPAFGARPAKATIHQYIEDTVMATF